MRPVCAGVAAGRVIQVLVGLAALQLVHGSRNSPRRGMCRRAGRSRHRENHYRWSDREVDAPAAQAAEVTVLAVLPQQSFSARQPPSTECYSGTMPLVAALVDDLMFLSRIREAARVVGADVRGGGPVAAVGHRGRARWVGAHGRPVRSVAAVSAACRDGATLVLLDLDSPRLPWLDALTVLSSEPAHPRPPRGRFFGPRNASTAG